MMYYNNRRLALNIFWVLLGTVLIVLSIAEILDSSIYAGLGGVLVGIGILRIIRTVKYRKDPEYREKIDTESDERSRFLRMKSWTWTGTIVIIIEGIASIIAMILGAQTIQLILAYSVCLILVVYCIMFLILSRKY